MPIVTTRTSQFDCRSGGGGIATRITLRGWLSFEGMNEGEAEAIYDFEPDFEWVRNQGIEIEKLLRVGNLLLYCTPKSPFPCQSDGSWWAMAGVPKIHVEANGWFALRNAGDDKMKVCRSEAPPAQWVAWSQDPNVWYPFVPEKPDPDSRIGFNESKEFYVEITGSLVADPPHTNSVPLHGPWTEYAHQSGQAEHVRQFWCSGGVTCFDHGPDDAQARWVEIHPVDRIKFLPDKPRTETVIMVAIASAFDNHSWGLNIIGPQEWRKTHPGPARPYLIEPLIVLAKDKNVTPSVGQLGHAVRLDFSVPIGLALPGMAGGSKIAAIARVGWTGCAPLAACGPICVNLRDDRDNCGSCGNACGDYEYCQNGRCRGCGPGQEWCGCVDRCVSERPGLCKSLCKQ